MLFKDIAKTFEKISSTTSRLEKTDLLYNLFKKCPNNQISNLIYFCKGILGPKYKAKEINIGLSTILQIISEYLSIPLEKVEKKFSKLGDVGLVIESNSNQNIKQKTLFSKELHFKDIFSILKKIADTSGKDSSKRKINLFKSILFNVDSTSAKYIVRFPLTFRLGFSNSTIIDALAKFKEDGLNKEDLKNLIKSKYLILSDLGYVSDIIVNKDIKDLKKLEIKYFVPIKSQLCERVKDLEDIYDRLSSSGKKEFLVDTKVDGFRLQVHKKNKKVKIFSRQEKDVTDMFPDIIDNLKSIDFDFIIDCEAIGYNKEKEEYVPFQITMKRKRKYNIKTKSKNIPLHLKIFDILYLKNKIIYNKKLKYRRKLLEENFNNLNNINYTKAISTKDIDELEEFFNSRINKGLEGIIAKDLDAKYKAGSRGYSWIKFKLSYHKKHDTIDAYIVGAFYGKGKRSDLGLGALLIALYDSNSKKYYTIAKIGSGLKEEDIKQLNKKLKKLKLPKKPKDLVTNIDADFYIQPKIIVEVNYDEITNSNLHTACYNKKTKQGLALRFPRLEKIRFDKEESNSLQTLKKLYSFQ